MQDTLQYYVSMSFCVKHFDWSHSCQRSVMLLLSSQERSSREKKRERKRERVRGERERENDHDKST